MHLYVSSYNLKTSLAMNAVYRYSISFVIKKNALNYGLFLIILSDQAHT